MTTTHTITITEQTYKSVRLEVDGIQIHLMRQDYTAKWDRKPRVYLSGKAIDPEMDMPPYSMKGDDAANDKAWRAYNKEEVRLQKELAKRGFKALEYVAGLTIHGDADLRFSRKAGCSCGCSPGMILQGSVYGNKPLFPFSTKVGDIFISADE